MYIYILLRRNIYVFFHGVIVPHGANKGTFQGLDTFDFLHTQIRVKRKGSKSKLIYLIYITIVVSIPNYASTYFKPAGCTPFTV